MIESDEQQQIREQVKHDLKYGTGKKIGAEEIIGFILGVGVVIIGFVVVFFIAGMCGIMLL